MSEGSQQASQGETNETSSDLSQELPTNEGRVSPLYHDFARVDAEMSNRHSFWANQRVDTKASPFPVTLHTMISDPQNNTIITWLPHGRAWRILDKKAFSKKIIPRYFKHGRFDSFMRQLHGYGFRRIPEGIDCGSYYHELFLSGMPHLCKIMKRAAKGTRAKHEKNPSIPDFYKMSVENPLPNNPYESTKIAAGTVVPTVPRQASLQPASFDVNEISYSNTISRPAEKVYLLDSSQNSQRPMNFQVAKPQSLVAGSHPNENAVDSNTPRIPLNAAETLSTLSSNAQSQSNATLLHPTTNAALTLPLRTNSQNFITNTMPSPSIPRIDTKKFEYLRTILAASNNASTATVQSSVEPNTRRAALNDAGNIITLIPQSSASSPSLYQPVFEALNNLTKISRDSVTPSSASSLPSQQSMDRNSYASSTNSEASLPLQQPMTGTSTDQVGQGAINHFLNILNSSSNTLGSLSHDPGSAQATPNPVNSSSLVPMTEASSSAQRVRANISQQQEIVEALRNVINSLTAANQLPQQTLQEQVTSTSILSVALDNIVNNISESTSNVSQNSSDRIPLANLLGQQDNTIAQSANYPCTTLNNTSPSNRAAASLQNTSHASIPNLQLNQQQLHLLACQNNPTESSDDTQMPWK